MTINEDDLVPLDKEKAMSIVEQARNAKTIDVEGLLWLLGRACAFLQKTSAFSNAEPPDGPLAPGDKEVLENALGEGRHPFALRIEAGLLRDEIPIPSQDAVYYDDDVAQVWLFPPPGVNSAPRVVLGHVVTLGDAKVCRIAAPAAADGGSVAEIRILPTPSVDDLEGHSCLEIAATIIDPWPLTPDLRFGVIVRTESLLRRAVRFGRALFGQGAVTVFDDAGPALGLGADSPRSSIEDRGLEIDGGATLHREIENRGADPVALVAFEIVERDERFKVCKLNLPQTIIVPKSRVSLAITPLLQPGWHLVLLVLTEPEELASLLDEMPEGWRGSQELDEAGLWQGLEKLQASATTFGLRVRVRSS